MKRALWLLAAALGTTTSAWALDARQVQRFVLGRGTALAACESLTASGSRRAPAKFPSAPNVTARTRLSGGIGQAPVSDNRGSSYVAHGEPRLSKLDSTGRTQWTARLSSEAAAAPVLLSDGSVLALTREGEAFVFSPSGAELARRVLPFAELRRRFLVVPRSNGGALAANGEEVLELDARARVVRRARARGPLVALLESNAGWLAVSESGSVQVGRTTGDLEHLAELGGSAGDGAAVSGDRMLALVDGHRVVVLDTASGHVGTLLDEPSLALSGPLALLPDDGFAFVVDGGFVSRRNADGSEAVRSDVGSGFDPAQRGLRPALLVADAAGALVATRSGSDALVARPDGNAMRLDGTACLDPFRVTPTAGGLLLACRSGQLFVVSDTAR